MGDKTQEYVVIFDGAHQSAKHLLDYMRGEDDFSIEVEDDEREELSEEELAKYIEEECQPKIVRAKNATDAIRIVSKAENGATRVWVGTDDTTLNDFEEMFGDDEDLSENYEGHENHEGHEGYMAVNTRLFGILKGKK